MAQDKGLLFFYDWRDAFESLSGDECKALLLAMLDYRREGLAPPAFEGGAKIAAAFIFPAIDRSIERASSGRKGGLRAQKNNSALTELEANPKLSSSTRQKTKDKDKDKDDSMADNPPRARFNPPTVEEVAAYCIERKNSVNPEKFVNHYQANGWVQSRGKPIKDWKAAVRNWETNGFDNAKSESPSQPIQYTHSDF